MKDTLKFYSNIYNNLFIKQNYTKSTFRAGVCIDRFVDMFPDYKNIINNAVDVGCAWGKALKFFKKNNINACGVDVSPYIVKKCKKRGYNCYLASATDLSVFKDKQFDLYLAADVYEHLRPEDIIYAIEEAKRITKKYLLIRPHPVLDKRKTLHLTVWSILKWKEFFESNGLHILAYGDGKTSYRNTFIMEQ